MTPFALLEKEARWQELLKRLIHGTKKVHGLNTPPGGAIRAATPSVSAGGSSTFGSHGDDLMEIQKLLSAAKGSKKPLSLADYLKVGDRYSKMK